MQQDDMRNHGEAQGNGCVGNQATQESSLGDSQACPQARGSRAAAWEEVLSQALPLWGTHEKLAQGDLQFWIIGGDSGLLC